MNGEKGKTSKKMTHGGRNLLILGVVSTVIAVVLTGVSLLIYHNSGDIYLDRSRPEYLPDEEEIKEEGEKEEEYVFDKSGALTAAVIEEYLTRLDMEVKVLDAYDGPFDGDALSDERLGIPEEENEEQDLLK